MTPSISSQPSFAAPSRQQLAQTPLSAVDLTSKTRPNPGCDRAGSDTHYVADLQALALQLTRAEDTERRRLAQVLHDGLQQLLVGALLHDPTDRSAPRISIPSR